MARWSGIFWGVYTLLFALVPSSEARVLDAAAIMHQQTTNMCALTFDDGPTAFTPQLLDSLKEEGVRATFFLLGKQIRMRPGLVRRMVEEGHEVASHGYSHPNMRKLSTAARYYELAETNTLLQELGVVPRYFRPPYGNYDAPLAAMAQDLGMSILMWTTDSRDWKRRPDYRNMPTSMGRRLLPEEMRGVFLFHDTKQATVQDVKLILSDLRDGGCQRFVTVSEYFDILPTQEPLLTASPEVPAKSSRDMRAESTAVAGEDESMQVATTPPAAPAGTTPVPMARSSTPWYVPTFLRSGG